MYKRQVHSAFGRGRPDLVRVADGIAASLRQFSISARRGAEDQAPPRSRTERTANATKEVSDLAPSPRPSKGIDARSLAAKPPRAQGFTITKYATESKDPGAFNTFVSRSQTSSSNFGPRPPMTSGSGRGGGFRGRGRGGPGAGGRGGRGGGVRGRNARGPKDKKPKFAEEIDFEILPYTEEEEPEYNMIIGGMPEAYNPVTSHSSLAGWGPSVITSTQGIKEMVDAKLGVAVDRKAPGYNQMEWHKTRLAKAGLTVFKDGEEREAAREWQRGKGWKTGQYTELSDVQKEKLASQWVGGHYDGPVPVDRKDVLGQVAKYAKANGTYLAEESRQLEQDVARLVPKAKPIQRAA